MVDEFPCYPHRAILRGVNHACTHFVPLAGSAWLRRPSGSQTPSGSPIRQTLQSVRNLRVRAAVGIGPTEEVHNSISTGRAACARAAEAGHRATDAGVTGSAARHRCRRRSFACQLNHAAPPPEALAHFAGQGLARFLAPAIRRFGNDSAHHDGFSEHFNQARSSFRQQAAGDTVCECDVADIAGIVKTGEVQQHVRVGEPLRSNSATPAIANSPLFVI